MTIADFTPTPEDKCSSALDCRLAGRRLVRRSGAAALDRRGRTQTVGARGRHHFHDNDVFPFRS
jgi:hypothetical protein